MNAVVRIFIEIAWMSRGEPYSGGNRRPRWLGQVRAGKVVGRLRPLAVYIYMRHNSAQTSLHLSTHLHPPEGSGRSEPEPTRATLDELVTAEQVAALLMLPVSTVKDYARRGVLPSIKLGKHRRFARLWGHPHRRA